MTTNNFDEPPTVSHIHIDKKRKKYNNNKTNNKNSVNMQKTGSITPRNGTRDAMENFLIETTKKKKNIQIAIINEKKIVFSQSLLIPPN